MNLKVLASAITVFFSVIASAQTEAPVSDDAATLTGNNDEGVEFSFIGSSARLSVGVDTDGDFLGEYLQVFGERPTSAWIGEAWLGEEGAGGLKLNFHWLMGARTEEEIINNPNDVAIAKAFVAVDQNEQDDRKVTAGGGYERNDLFGAAYFSKSITGRRFKGESSSSTTEILTGVETGRAFTQSRTTETLTRVFVHPYDYGVGARLGRFFDNGLIAAYGGLDYEWGDEDSEQYTLSFGLDKFFTNSPHSLGVRVEAWTKSGDFESDDEDAVALFLYRYDFGQSHRPAKQYRQVQVAAAPAAAQQTVVKNEITLGSKVLFAFDRASLSPQAVDMLQDITESLKDAKLVGPISVVGHTDSIGTVSYNYALSRRRAKSVVGFMIKHGISPDAITADGKSELEPVASNETPEGRQLNRRVVITAMTVEEAEAPAPTPGVAWKKELIKTPPAWVSRALRNTVPHKRTVDVYRIEEKETTVALGDKEFLNNPPVAEDDAATVEQDSSSTLIDVLANDSDPDGDSLMIASVTQPANGTVVNVGNAVTYMPNPGFSGIDTFTYTVEDGNGGSDSATVTVTVLPNQPPQINDDQATTVKNGTVVIDVLANDVDPDGDPLTVTGIIPPTLGTAVLNADGTITYTPNPGWFGGDEFSYTAEDGRGGSGTARVVITVRVR